MLRNPRQLAHDFMASLSAGQLPDALFTTDVTVWTTTGGVNPLSKYRRALTVLQSLFVGGLHYTIDSLTAEQERVAAEVQGRGKLLNGQHYHNDYVYILRVREGRIARVNEHCNPIVVNDTIIPLLEARQTEPI